MKTVCTLLALVAFASVSRAGIVGWWTSGTRDWTFIQQTGGIRIEATIEKEGRQVLPVEYVVQGTVAITCQPTLTNSGLAVRRIEAKKHGSVILVRVITQVIEKGSDTGRLHYADLSHIPTGSYEVYYETDLDQTKHLGRITVK